MSWLDPNPPPGDIYYHVRRECVDARYEWTSPVSDIPVPTLPTLISAEAKQGEVTLKWFPGTTSDVGTVYRRTTDSDWVSLGTATREADDLLVFRDRGLAQGRYAYRLEIHGATTTPEAWVDVPGAIALAVEGFRPNPAAGPLAVAFSLPTSAPATLAIFSVTGRQVFETEIGSLGPGPHVINVGRSDAMRSGIYWIRVVQGSSMVTTKGIIAR